VEIFHLAQGREGTALQPEVIPGRLPDRATRFI
jgi:hypothetical protein